MPGHSKLVNGIFMTRLPTQNALFKQIACILLVAMLISAPVSAQEAQQPSKEKFIEILFKVVDQLEAEKYAEIDQYFYLPEDFEHRMFAQLLKRKVISRPGVKALELGGEYGNAIGVLKKSDVEKAAAEFAVPIDQCFAMKMKQGEERCEVLAHWTEKGFRILDLNGVGAMVPEKVELGDQSPLQPWPTGDKPTKELLIETLKVFLHQIENRHYDASRPNIYVPEDFQMSRLSDSLERGELSAAGIMVLAEKGSFGKAVQVYSRLRAESLTKRVQVPVDESYGLVAKIAGEEGEVLAHWMGDRYKLIRTDDVGKLPAALKTASKPVANGSPNPTEVAPPARSEHKPAIASATLPKYETDKSVVMANYPALAQAVESNPKDVSQRARFVQSLLVIGNVPKAWSEAVEIYRLEPENIEVTYAIDQSIEGLNKSGIFQVGVPQETIESLMGKPLNTASVEGVTRWEYPNWHVDFSEGRFVKLSSAKPAASTKPATTAAAETKPATENRNRFGLRLMSFERRVSAILLIRTDKKLGLKETMDLIKTLPVEIFDGLSQVEAEAIKARYAEKGLVTEITETSDTKVEPEVRSTFSIELSSFGSNKIAVIKVIRELNSKLSLMEAKRLTENLPSIVLTGVSQDQASAAKEKFAAAGATVEIK